MRLEIGVVFPPCRHEYCSSCLLQWLSTTVADRTLQFPTKCAHEACPATLSAVHAESLLVNPAYHNLREKYGLRILESEGRVVTCPQPNCCATIILPDQSLRDLAADDLSILCTACNSIMCVRCNVPDHWPRPCADVQSEIDCKIDAPVLLLAKENKWMRCPNCHAIVERRDGCNHIKCLCGTGLHHRRMPPSYAREIRNGLRDHYRHGQPLRIHTLDIIRGIPPRQVLPPCVGRTVHGPAWEDSDSDEYVMSSDDDDGSSSGDDDLPPEPKRLLRTWKRNRFGRRIMACGTGEVLHPDKSTARLPKWLERTYRHFTCHYCTEPFRTWPMLVDHFHTTRAHEVYMCCGRTFKDANGFICHLDHVHEGCPDFW
ncbi:hypothetical protein GGF31_006151 [Allomyces arbusculus]|nr:hypothetical protein GGF31_006151 [Allomyces arbusculus]